MIIKFKAELLGGHWHVGVWMGRSEGALGKCGNLVFAEEEWPFFINFLRVGEFGIHPDQLTLIIQERCHDEEPAAEAAGKPAGAAAAE